MFDFSSRANSGSNLVNSTSNSINIIYLKCIIVTYFFLTVSILYLQIMHIYIDISTKLQFINKLITCLLKSITTPAALHCISKDETACNAIRVKG